jgi:hemerythrin-like domain-containing protein
MRRVHQRLREALRVTSEAIDSGVDATSLGHDLLLFCHGSCTALSGHHRGEDRLLFPALAEARPELIPTLERLRQDHSMMEHLLVGLQHALERESSAAQLQGQLDGIAAIMESHFRYEERQLLAPLESLDLAAEVGDVLGPL